MIELRGLVAYKGMEPIDATLRRGEVVTVTGNPRERHLLLEVLARQRTPVSGSVRWADEATTVLVRAADELPAGLAAFDGLSYYAAAWGRPVPDKSEYISAPSVRRGLVVDANAWLIADPVTELPGGARSIVNDVADRLRTGQGVLIAAVNDADEEMRGDRHWQLAAPSEPTTSAPPAQLAPAQGAADWRRLVPLELRRAFQQPATGVLGAIGLLIAYALWSIVPSYEGYWFTPGSVAAYAIAAHAACIIGAAATATLAASSQLAPSQIMRETPLGHVGHRRLQRIGMLVPCLALTAALSVVAAWAWRSGASGITTTAFYVAWPAVTAAITLALVELLDSLGLGQRLSAVVAAAVGAAIGVLVGGFGLLW